RALGKTPGLPPWVKKALRARVARAPKPPARPAADRPRRRRPPFRRTPPFDGRRSETKSAWTPPPPWTRAGPKAPPTAGSRDERHVRFGPRPPRREACAAAPIRAAEPAREWRAKARPHGRSARHRPLRIRAIACRWDRKSFLTFAFQL